MRDLAKSIGSLVYSLELKICFLIHPNYFSIYSEHKIWTGEKPFKAKGLGLWLDISVREQLGR